MTARFVVPVVALVGLSWGAFSYGGDTEEPDEAAADRVKVVRASYEKLPPLILGIVEPIRVTQCTHQKVPVVINLIFTDADGTNQHFSWWLDKGNFLNAEYDRIDWVHYKGPDSLGARKFRLAIRGPEEGALYGLLLRWSATKVAAKDLSLFDRQMLDEVNRFLEKLDERIASAKPVLQK
ncbi:MAG TPA: hypothetical protein VGH74_00970 [Planctomycetaceae bacterium]|jgi:hypothetical protein